MQRGDIAVHVIVLEPIIWWVQPVLHLCVVYIEVLGVIVRLVRVCLHTHQVGILLVVDGDNKADRAVILLWSG